MKVVKHLIYMFDIEVNVIMNECRASTTAWQYGLLPSTTQDSQKYPNTWLMREAVSWSGKNIHSIWRLLITLYMFDIEVGVIMNEWRASTTK